MNKAVSFVVGMVAGAAALAAAAWFTDKVSRKNEDSDDDDSILESADCAGDGAVEGVPPSDSKMTAEEAAEEQLTATA